ncbi:MAG: beta-galactosidase trimerization domain-containing protein [Verrucomicrobia bacterium]|nr:beta-galactosidase trimerization domain-containing protein [Verrucomicrobiota bacterium]
MKPFSAVLLSAALVLSLARAVPLPAPEASAVGTAAAPVWISMQDARAWSPLMTPASRVGLMEAEALGDFLVPMVTATADKPATNCWVEFSVTVPKAGAYWLWGRVRFPAGAEEALRVADTNAGDGAARVVFTGGVEPRRWHWVNSGQVQLPAGAWTFRVQPQHAAASTFGPLRWQQAELTQTPRLNLFCLSDDPKFVPTDAGAQSALHLTMTPPPVPRVEPARLAPLAADWQPPEHRQRVPDWMRCPRWFTKDSWRDELRHRQPGDIAALVREVAANGGETLRLSCLWGGEAFFQSRVAPHAPGLGELDYLHEALDEGTRTGVKVAVYMNPNALCLGHPLADECVIRDAAGQASKRPAYGAAWRPEALYACINHPRYRRFLQEVLTEMFTRYRPAGLYVDGLTPHVCFCEHCRAKWRELFGTEMPVPKLSRIGAGWAVWSEFGRDPQPVGDVENDADARRWTEMMHRTLVEMTHEVSRTVKQAKPDAVTLFHSHPKPGSDADYDGTLTEVYSPRPWVHTAWRSGELAGYSAVYRVPVLFNIYPHRHFTAAEARAHALQGLANGAYPNFWSAAGMKPVFDFMRRCADGLDFETAAPVKFLALPRDLHESDTQRRARPAPGLSYAPRDRFLAPYVGAYSALMRSGLPVVTLHRPHFEEGLAGFKVVALANVALMSEAQVEAVRRFVRDGGGLVATHETSLLDEKGQRRADFALADVLGVHYQNTLPAAARTATLLPNHPLASGLPTNTPLAHDEPLVSVTLAGAGIAGTFASGEAAVLTHRYGKGRVVYLPGRFDSMQCYSLTPAVERLLANAVCWVAPDGLPVEVKADGPVGVSLFRQPGRLVVHLVNHQRDSQLRSDTVTPLQKVLLRVALPDEAREPKVRRLWEDRALRGQVKGRTLQVDVGTLEEYEAVAVEW